MDTPRPTGDRVPLGDLTNTTHGGNHPPVQQLQLHLPDMHMVAFHKREKVERIVNRPGVEESMLAAYLDANRDHEEARGILYRDFPEHFTWQSDGKFWQKRKNSVFQVGRVISARPAEGERYFLRVLLNNLLVLPHTNI
ncbi:uncharacterized protein [Miscanthus floridulus]|uniref:uncharacterized protein n=1 Tax=Miscanthus floridulus TaxID=154761 RepID=UPI00345B4248